MGKIRNLLKLTTIITVVSLGVSIMGCNGKHIDAAASKKDEEKYIFLCKEGLEKLKNSTESLDKRKIKELENEAEKLLDKKTISVAEKKLVPKGATKNDYVSLSTYYWPDPSKKDGLPWIPNDGLKNPETNNGDKYDINRKEKMVKSVDTLALAYYFSDDEKYAEKATEFLYTWFVDSETRMNPNFNYSQIRPGKEEQGGLGVLDGITFESLMDSFNLLKGSKAWNEEVRNGVKKWFQDYTDWALSTEKGKQEGNRTNNRGTWYDSQIVIYGQFVDKQEIVKKVAQQAMEKRIAQAIKADGEMPEESKRATPISYTFYNLEALITLSQGTNNIGINLYGFKSKEDVSIKNAIDYTIKLIDSGKAADGNIRNFIPYLAMANRYYKSSDYEKIVSTYIEKLGSSDYIVTRSNFILGYKNN